MWLQLFKTIGNFIEVLLYEDFEFKKFCQQFRQFFMTATALMQHVIQQQLLPKHLFNDVSSKSIVTSLAV